MITVVYAIRWSKRVEKFLSKLPVGTARRIVNKVSGLEERPFSFLECHEGTDLFKLWVGSYRLLADVDLTANIIFVRALGHRKNIYKGFY